MQPDHADPTLELKRLVQNQGIKFDLKFSEKIIFGFVQQLNLISLQKTKFSGTILPLDKGDWALSGTLGASVSQPCILTLRPVRTRIDITVVRNFRKSMLIVSDTVSEKEIANNENDEQLNQIIDISRLFCEALSLELPDYPRGTNVVAAITEYGPPGIVALTDHSTKPFAVLAGLKGKIN